MTYLYIIYDIEYTEMCLSFINKQLHIINQGLHEHERKNNKHVQCILIHNHIWDPYIMYTQWRVKVQNGAQIQKKKNSSHMQQFDNFRTPPHTNILLATTSDCLTIAFVPT